MMLYSLLLVVPLAWASATGYEGWGWGNATGYEGWGWGNATGYEDLPCAARSFPNKSVVCVCTEDYCDTVIRETPVSGQYYMYTSSLSGQRFNKTYGYLTTCGGYGIYDVTLTLDPSKTYQNVNGFGGAVTDAAAMNYVNMTSSLQKQFIESYCGAKGVQYSMLRLPIGGTDYSPRGYGYNLYPENDTTLSNFSLAYEDYEYKLPMIKACMEASSMANSSMNMLGSLWSPPPWMKTNYAYNGFGWLKDEYYQTLADYFYKFLEAYEEEGVPVWGVTITNEPLNGITNAHNPNSLGWTLDQMGNWLCNNLGPTLRNSSSAFKHVKILANDEHRYLIPLYYNLLVRTFPKAMDYIDGVAVHWYADKNASATIMQKAMEKSPDKFLLQTEAAIIASSMEEYPLVTVDYGSWTRAERYIRNILEYLNYNSTGWLDWNMALNTAGGPSWLNHKIDAPIIVNATGGEFYKQPMFYAIGHFSKFLPLDSVRIDVTTSVYCATCSCASCDNGVESTAFQTPDGTTVVIIYNRSDVQKTVNIVMDDNEAIVTVCAKAVSTIEFLS